MVGGGGVEAVAETVVSATHVAVEDGRTTKLTMTTNDSPRPTRERMPCQRPKATAAPQTGRPGPASGGPVPGPGCSRWGLAGLLGYGQPDPLAGPEQPPGGVGGVEADLAAAGQLGGGLDTDRSGRPRVRLLTVEADNLGQGGRDNRVESA
jgi:hypothetical protein